MTLSITHAFVSAKADGVDATLVQPSNWNAGLTTSMATGKILGRSSALTGVIEELPGIYTATGTASASASIVFSSIPSWVNNLSVKMSKVVPGDNGSVFYLQYSEDNGSTWKTANYRYGYEETSFTNGTAAYGHSVSATGIVLGSSLANAAVSSNVSYVGQVDIFNINDTTFWKNCVYQSMYFPGSDSASNSGGGTYSGDAGAVNAIRFIMSSGVITTGNFVLTGAA